MRRALIWSVSFGAALLGTLAMLTLVLLASSGGLRIRSPLGAMEKVAGDFDTSGFEVLGTESSGNRVCFLQCAAWRYEIYLAPADGETVSDCVALRSRATDWLGVGLDEFNREDPLGYQSRCFYASNVDGHPSRVAFASQAPARPGPDVPAGSVWIISIIQE